MKAATPPTTKDLAKAAGVSRATVDRVLNGRDGVKQKTAERVKVAIRELSFVRNLQAANLARRRNYRFLFALPQARDEFVQQIVRHVEEATESFSADQVWATVQHINENDPHNISDFLTSRAFLCQQKVAYKDSMGRLLEKNRHSKTPGLGNS